MSVARGDIGETHQEERLTMSVARGEIEERLNMRVARGDRGETHHERSERRNSQ
jgi:hypothetical protein